MIWVVLKCQKYLKMAWKLFRMRNATALRMKKNKEAKRKRKGWSNCLSATQAKRFRLTPPLLVPAPAFRTVRGYRGLVRGEGS